MNFLKSPATILALIMALTNAWQFFVTGANLKSKNKTLTTQLVDAQTNNKVLLKSLTDQRTAAKKTREINKTLTRKNKIIVKHLSAHAQQLLVLKRKLHEKKYLDTVIPGTIVKLMRQWPGARKNSTAPASKTRPGLARDPTTS